MAEIPGNDPKTALTAERTSFAMFRTSLALDRTTLAWVRTAVTFATFGIGMIGFFRALRQATQTEEAARMHQAAIHFGVALVVMGLVATILMAVSHGTTLRRLRRGEQLVVSQLPLTITFALPFRFSDSTCFGRTLLEGQDTGGSQDALRNAFVSRCWARGGRFGKFGSDGGKP